VINVAIVMKQTLKQWFNALMASAIARWVFPTPGGPKKITFSCLAIKVRSKSSITAFLSSWGWKVKS
jgi:hypothetical protein